MKGFNAPGPILLQQPGERSIRQHPSTGLAARAVIGLIVRITYALHRRVTDGAWQAGAAVHGHIRAKRRDVLGEGPLGMPAQPLGP